MLKEIRDCQGHIVCFADATTGEVEAKYKKHTIRTNLLIGGEIKITREKSETVIKRISEIAFELKSYPIAS